MDKYLMLKELEVTYKKVSVSFLKARNYPKSENLHDFRKKAKDFLYQLFYFRAMKPKVIKEVERKLDLMAQNLGKYNDYSVLIEAIGYRYLPGGNSTPVDELVLLIKQEQDKYLSKVWPSAFSVFRPGLKLADVLGLKIVIV
jgi:CHAD domain-containing protein